MGKVWWLSALSLVFAPVTSAAIPSVGVRSAAGGEGGRAVFTVRLAKPSSKPLTVRFATREGSARPGVDFVARSGTLRFAPGRTVKRVTVRLLDDDEPEASETFSVRIAGKSARGTIRPSDLPAPFTTVARMDGSRSLSGGNPNATGTATLTFDPEIAQVRSTVTVERLGARSGIPHLHRGSAGAEGPLLVSLVGPFDNASSSGSNPISLALILEIFAAPERFYLDVHTQMHPFGAIRGQLERVQ